MKRIGVKKKGQQEMVGFVLIVVVIVIALMIFLVISMRKPVQTVESSQLENMLSSMMAYTTECAINSEPDYDNLGDLIKSCYEDQKCANTGQMACASMKNNLDSSLEDIMKSEAIYSSYEFNVTVVDKVAGGGASLYSKHEGNCTGSSQGGSSRLSIDSQTSIGIQLKLCS